ncbi:MAG: exodeoxyribonuclease III [Deltaproteobacteria bacterium]|nr:exodeoxyribonuclease III [Deltaproteobacteria bacterium]
MRIGTWNVNSVRVREERLLAVLERHRPDVLALQEIKVETERFPRARIEALGYHVTALGQKTYNGVALLSREPAEDVREGLDDQVDDAQARLLAARFGDVHVISAYFPNGGELGSPKYAYKLEWMRRLEGWLERHADPSEAWALLGDFNVAPTEADVAMPERWRDTTLTCAEVRDALERIRGFGLRDLFRLHRPEAGLFSWWDYRRLAFPKGDGLRIDHIYGSDSLAARSTDAFIDRDERKGKQPSDHAPVFVDLA